MLCRELYGHSLGSALGEKGEKNWRSRKKKSASQASLEVFWPTGSARLALMADIYFFLFDPVFCLFPPLRSLVSGHMVTTDFKLGEIKKTREL